MTKKINIFIIGPFSGYINWIDNAVECDNIINADLVLFAGGEDVDPSLYNEKPHTTTYSNINRDISEKKIYQKAKYLGIPCIGICRGNQFLCVMN